MATFLDMEHPRLIDDCGGRLADRRAGADAEPDYREPREPSSIRQHGRAWPQRGGALPAFFSIRRRNRSTSMTRRRWIPLAMVSTPSWASTWKVTLTPSTWMT